MNLATSPRIRVLHVLPALGKKGRIGGAERVCVQLVTRLPDHGPFESRLCVLGARDPFYASYGLREEPISLEKPDFHKSLRTFVQTRNYLSQVLRDWRPEIVHSHLWTADLVTATAVSGKGTRHIVHLHDWWALMALQADGGFKKRLLRRIICRSALKISRAHFIACSETIKNQWVTTLPLDPSLVEVVRNGIDERWIGPPPRDPDPNRFVVGSAGRFQPAKGHILLVEAVAAISSRIPGIRLRLAGEGSGQRACCQLAQELNIADRVEFLGGVCEMLPFYDSLDVYASASLCEGLPITLLEAMARGLPVVATNVGGIAELVRHGTDGLIVPPKDVGALAEALATLALNLTLRVEMGRAAQLRVRDSFSLDAMVERVARYYERVLARS